MDKQLVTVLDQIGNLLTTVTEVTADSLEEKAKATDKPNGDQLLSKAAVLRKGVGAIRAMLQQLHNN
ncbi:MAG: hypothetical protein ACLPOO_20190 [Terriglobales bacterium]